MAAGKRSVPPLPSRCQALRFLPNWRAVMSGWIGHAKAVTALFASTFQKIGLTHYTFVAHVVYGTISATFSGMLTCPVLFTIIFARPSSDCSCWRCLPGIGAAVVHRRFPGAGLGEDRGDQGDAPSLASRGLGGPPAACALELPPWRSRGMAARGAHCASVVRSFFFFLGSAQ